MYNFNSVWEFCRMFEYFKKNKKVDGGLPVC